MALVKTAEYYFARFELNFSHRGVVDGASYTDVQAQLPALEPADGHLGRRRALFIWNICRRGWVLPVIAVGLWAFVSLVVGTIYPAGIQHFKVKPNEFAKERQYIARNIDATRDAFNLDKVDVKQLRLLQELGPTDKSVVDSNRTTIDNARLWDPTIIGSTYQPLQALADLLPVQRRRRRPVHRRRPDQPELAVSARELEQRAPAEPDRGSTEHLVYTHGYGVDRVADESATSDGQPELPPQRHPGQAAGHLARPTGRAGLLRREPQRLLDRRRASRRSSTTPARASATHRPATPARTASSCRASSARRPSR